MKKLTTISKISFILLLNLLFLAVISSANAQSIAKRVGKSSTSANGMSPVIYRSKTVILDEKNAYMRENVTTEYNNGKTIERTSYYIDYGLWKSAKGTLLGRFSSLSDAQLSFDSGGCNLVFLNDKDEILSDLYDEKLVISSFREALDKITAKGAEGTERFYAEIPRKGTTIKLYVVLKSEMEKNKGIPKWKMLFGELQFDKETGKFTFVKK